jgi:hypothetical protein
MVGGRPPADVALAKKRRDEHPWVSNYLLAACQIQRYGNIEPAPYPSKPALLSPSGQKFGGRAPINPEGLSRNINRYDFLGGAKYRSEPRAGGWQ